MERQCTLKQKFSLEGKGLHTGIEVCITFNPAPKNYGYKIKRTDLEGQPIINATVDNAVRADRSTVLSVNNVHISTVEHALAALYGCEVDNCLIEIDGPEFPILDGSSIEYVNKIIEVGTVEQMAQREYYIPKHKIEYKDSASGTHLYLLPSNDFSVYSQISFDSVVLDIQNANIKDLSEFRQEIAMCRTFVFVKEIEALLKNGLIKGGDLDNAIVIYDKPIEQVSFNHLADIMNVERRQSLNLGYIMNEPLRFSNEPARHKLLDVIGDIALVGKFIKGTIVAVRPSHKANNAFARIIQEEIKKNRRINTLTMAEYVA